MKKISFPLIVTLLVCIILTLIGYNTLLTHQQSQKYQNQQTKPTQTSNDTSSRSGPTIYCIGDSLTLGSHAYPNYLFDMTNANIETFGGSKDQTIDTAIRTGRTKVYVNDITIPEQTKAVEITLYNADHEKLDNVLKNSGSNFSNVTIDGISGILKYNANKKVHTFTRDEPGDELEIHEYTQVLSDFPTFDKDAIAIIFTGTYDPYESGSIFKTITYQRAILNQLGVKKYIVVSLTSKRTFPIVKDMNAVLEEEHGEHFLNFREYLLENGLKDANVTATQEDQKDLDKGYIPRSLLQENLVDGNEKFHKLLAEQLIKKLKDLKYITDKDLNSENL